MQIAWNQSIEKLTKRGGLVIRAQHDRGVSSLPAPKQDPLDSSAAKYRLADLLIHPLVVGQLAASCLCVLPVINTACTHLALKPKSCQRSLCMVHSILLSLSMGGLAATVDALLNACRCSLPQRACM